MKKKAIVDSITKESFFDPSFIKTLSGREVDRACEVIREEIIQATASHGGHLSANLGTVELTVALHRAFDLPKDKLLFDVGHQCYAHKILSGRDLSKLNVSGGYSGFQKRKESEFDSYEAGHSSTAISAAEAFAYARDKKGENYHVVAVVGDASIVNGLSFEGLNSVGGNQTKIIVVLNDNEMSITPPVGGASKFFRRVASGATYQKLKLSAKRVLSGKVGRKIYDFLLRCKNRIKRVVVPLNLFDNLGFAYIGPVDGHNVAALEKVFKKAKIATKPVLIHVITQKGKGYPYAEQDKTGYWHAVSPYEVKTGQPTDCHPGLISWSHYYADLIEASLPNHDERIVISPATLKGSNLDRVFSYFPKQSMDVGIAEEHAFTYAGALGLNGFHPIISIYSTFLQRAYDELSHDVARMNVNMTVLIERSGMQGYNGETHQGIYDEAYLKSIPNVMVTMPSNKAEARYLYEESLKDNGVFCIRIPREFVKEAEEDAIPSDIRFGQFRHVKVSQDKKLCVISVGPKCREIEALSKAKNLDFELINPLFLFPLDEKSLLPLLPFKTLIIHDAYSTKEGFAESLLARLLELGYAGKVVVRAIPRLFVDGDSKLEQEKKYGLTSVQLMEEIAKAL